MSGVAGDWLRAATGSRVADFYSAIGVVLPDRGGAEAEVSCFTNQAAHKNGDRNASCSVNLLTGLWACHGCGQSGNAYRAALARGFTERRARELAQAHGLFLEAASDPDASKVRLPTEVQLRKWRGALRCSVLSWPGDPQWTLAQVEMSHVLLRRLWEVKGWTPQAVVRCGLGWDGERITFTIRDKKLKRVGVVRYLPGGSPKSKALTGSKRLLFPPPEVMSRRRPLYLVEGEPAAVSMRACGLQAVGIAGTQGWRAEFSQRLAGFQMIFLPDADPQGRDLARRVSSTMPNVKVVDIDPSCQDGSDVGDVIAEAAHEGGYAQVRRALERLAA